MHSVGGISALVVEICDAVRSFVEEDDLETGLIRLSEALAGLGRTPDEGPGVVSAKSPVDHALTALVELAKAQEALLQDDARRADLLIRAAADHLAAAVRTVQRSQRAAGTGENGDHGAPVQLSVSEALRVPNEEAISDSLRNLLARSESQAFVIFVDARTGNFCQFIGSKNAPLLLDLPYTSLDEEERGRARRFFGDQGYEDVEGDEGFSVNVGRDVQAGTALALGTFTKVYRADPNFSLKIEEN